MSFEAVVHAQAIELDRLSLQMTSDAGAGHPTTALSLGHIVTTLMFSAMRWSPDYPDYPTSDRLVLSEGHAVPIVYAAAAKLGMMVGTPPGGSNEDRRRLTIDDLSTLRAADSLLDGHPNPIEGMPLFDAATGSLGQGLSVAAGLGKAARIDGIDKLIYCIIGDGEFREGQIAEAIDFIMDHKLNNVLTLVNANQYGQAALDTYRARAADDKNAPMAIVAKTVKGWGCPSIQGGGWHGKPPAGEALERALAELDERLRELSTSLDSSDHFEIEPPPAAEAQDMSMGELPPFADTMKALDMESVLHAGKLATRKAYGIALRAMGHQTNRLVVLDADVSNSTFAETFAKDAALAPRFVECKIGEQNMISAAAGMSASGKVPFASTFAKFVTRAYDQIEMAMNGGANLKIVGSHSGSTLAADGPSQMSLPDVAWFRSLSSTTDHNGNPGCYILQPADAYAAYALTGVMAEYEGLCYMRTLRADTEFIYGDDQVFNLGGFETLTEGRDVVLCACGYMVHEGNRAVDLLD